MEYDYTFLSTDVNGDNVSYYIDWGDDTISDWVGPFESGQEIIQSHTWDEQGDYTIRCKARDIYEDESEWGYLEVTMPMNQPAMGYHMLERLSGWFPLLYRILLNY